MNALNLRDVRWGPVALGWICAVVVNIVLVLIFAAIGLAITNTATDATGITAGGFIGSIIIGFIAHLVGGYVAGQRAGTAGPLNGAMVAVFGLAVIIVLTIIIGIFALLFFDGPASASPPVWLGYAGSGFLTVVVNFIFNLLGGYLGGRFSGNQSSGNSQRPSRVR